MVNGWWHCVARYAPRFLKKIHRDIFGASKLWKCSTTAKAYSKTEPLNCRRGIDASSFARANHSNWQRGSSVVSKSRNMTSTVARSQHLISVEEYLEGERLSEIR